MPAIPRLAVLVALVLSSSAPVEAQGDDLPSVLLIATGGTISNRPGARLTAAELIVSVPTLDQHVRAEAEQFSNVASSALTLDQWLALARRVNDVFDSRPEMAGIVITSGTDTLEETAYFLHLTVRSERPVVLVGSMRPPGSPGYDGSANLLQAFRVAAEPTSRNRGVLVVLNEEINSAREVVKTNAQRLQTFDTRGYGVLGIVDPDEIRYYRRTERRHTHLSEFDLDEVESLPRVDIVLTYLEAPGDLVTAAVERGAQGLVVAGAGAGSLSRGQRDALRAAIDRGLIVVVTTRTGAGRVPPRGPRPDQDVAADPSVSPNQISGEDLAPVKARILLMLALNRTRDGAQIQRMFSEY